MRRTSFALLAGIALAGAATAALAQTAPAPTGTAAPALKKKKFDPYQSPWATIMQSRLKADVPEARDFVRDSRPAKKDLNYTPLQSQLGPDPVRPKPRDAANIMALQAELEQSLSHNTARGGLGGKTKAHRKPKAAATN